MIDKIAIHHRSGSFSDQWIDYCKNNKISFKIVNCYDNDIIDQLKDCQALMWHFHHRHPKDILFAKQLMFALEQSGIKTFPNFNTIWHFDDKVGQKYLFEAINEPLVNTYVFYDKKEALVWAKKVEFPKVFKLRSGSGSSNVQLVNSRDEAKKLIRKAFGSGFHQRNVFLDIKERYRNFRIGKEGIDHVIGGFYRLIKHHDYERVKGSEKGYVYFQDYIPDNNFDIRVVVIDGKAFAIKRAVREKDFRASGSGKILYEKSNFNDNDISLAQNLARRLNTQSLAIDFVFNQDRCMILEISYGFTQQVFELCVGYWDQDLNFHEGPFNPYGWMVEGILKEANSNAKDYFS